MTGIVKDIQSYKGKTVNLSQSTTSKKSVHSDKNTVPLRTSTVTHPSQSSTVSCPSLSSTGFRPPSVDQEVDSTEVYSSVIDVELDENGNYYVPDTELQSEYDYNDFEL